MPHGFWLHHPRSREDSGTIPAAAAEADGDAESGEGDDRTLQGWLLSALPHIQDFRARRVGFSSVHSFCEGRDIESPDRAADRACENETARSPRRTSRLPGGHL